MRKAKIVCTIGPVSESREMMIKLIQAGMNVARLNFSHGDHEEQGNRIRLLKELRKEMDVPLGIMLDTKGPEIRIGKFASGQEELLTGQSFVLTTENIQGDASRVSISYKDLPKDVYPGTQILLDDGLIELTVERIEGEEIICTVLNGGTIKNTKGVNLPGTTLGLPPVSDKDREDIIFGCQMGIDFIAASFVQSAQDIHTIRNILIENGSPDIQIIAKIENRIGVDNIDEILSVTDGIMVARGDLGVEIPIEDVPIVQKRLIHLCNLAGKPVITATQMLESMIHNPRPTRAEANDVANSIIDGSDAIMLSGETAAGSYPIEAVKTMDRIASYAQMVPHRIPSSLSSTITAAVSHACCDIAADLGAKAIITPTKSGATPATVARHRPECTVIACAMNDDCFHRLSMYWGIIPLLVPELDSTDELISCCLKVVVAKGMLQSGDIAVITAGVPLSMAGTTNLIHVQIVGDVLMRGEGVGAKAVYGRACLANSPTLSSRFMDGDVLVSRATDNALLPLMKRAAALVVEDGDILGHAAVVGLALDIPVILAAQGALSRIQDGMYITVDASTGFIYHGKMPTA